MGSKGVVDCDDDVSVDNWNKDERIKPFIIPTATAALAS